MDDHAYELDAEDESKYDQETQTWKYCSKYTLQKLSSFKESSDSMKLVAAPKVDRSFAYNAAISV